MTSILLFIFLKYSLTILSNLNKGSFNCVFSSLVSLFALLNKEINYLKISSKLI